MLHFHLTLCHEQRKALSDPRSAIKSVYSQGGSALARGFAGCLGYTGACEYDPLTKEVLSCARTRASFLTGII